MKRTTELLNCNGVRFKLIQYADDRGFNAGVKLYRQTASGNWYQIKRFSFGLVDNGKNKGKRVIEYKNNRFVCNTEKITVKEVEMNREEKIYRLKEIKEEMLELLEEALSLATELGEGDASYSYWYAHILTALTNDHPFLGGSMLTLEETIEKLELKEEEEEYDDD